MNFCVPFQIGKYYCVNENKDVKAHFAFFFKFSFFPSALLYNTYGHFTSKFSQKLLDLRL